MKRSKKAPSAANSAHGNSSSNNNNNNSKRSKTVASTTTSGTSNTDGAGGEFLARLLTALPTHLIPSATPLSDKHPVCRWLLSNEPNHNNNSKSGSHSHHSSQPPQPASSSIGATAPDPSSLQHNNNKTNNNSSNNETSNTATTYWLVLATHCLQQLLPLPQQQPETTIATAQVVAWLCHGISQVVPRNKLDTSVVTKQIVGRALLVVSLGASQALPVLTSSSPTHQSAITACIVALDRVTVAIQPHAASAIAAPSDAYWNSLQWEPNLQPSTEFLESLRQSAVMEQDWSAADVCYRALTAVSPSEDKSSSSDHVLESFQQLLKGQSTTFSEGRLALKRWSAIALTWYSGQEQMLRAALQLLMQNEHWSENSGVICQAVVPAEDLAHHKVSSGVSPSRKEKKSASVAPTTTSITVVIDIPSNVAKLALVGRLCHVVHETSATAGSRPPTGELDVFLKSLTNATTTTVKKGQKLQRSDDRDLVMVIAYQWIQQHKACLRKNYEACSSSAKMVINDEEADAIRQGHQGGSTNYKSADIGTISSSSSSSLEPLYYYYPFVHQALQEIAIVASINATGSTTMFQCRDRIEFAAAAFVIQSQHEAVASQTHCPLDAKLTRFAVEKLISCLSVGSSTGSRSDPMADSVLSMVTAAATSATSSETMNSRARRPTASSHKSVRPLPIPSLLQSTTKCTATRKRKAASAAPVPHCSFAGVYHEPSAKGGSNNNSSAEFSADEKLLLFLQSVHGHKNDNDKSAADPIEPTMASSQLASHLLWILETCLDTRELRSEDSATPLKGNKRKAISTTMTRSNKRRKRVGPGGTKKNNDGEDPGGKQMVSDYGYKPIKGVRCTVASETMNALGLFLRDPLVVASLTAIQATLRQSVTVEQMKQLLALGPVLYQVIVKSRVHAFEALVREANGNQSALTGLEDADRYSDQEQTLWMKHKDLLVVLGRGREDYEEQMRTTPICGDLRLGLYKRVAELSKRRSPKGWPLSLNPVHHFFLASSLTAEPIVPISEIVGREADIFIVDGFVTELESALKEIGSPTTNGSLSLSEDIAVTWNDARIFLAAFTRLTPEEQSSMFSSLLIPVDRVFARLTDVTEREKNKSVLACKGVSSFLARLVTLCVNTYVMMCFGSGARDELFRALGKYIADMPSTSASEEWFTADNAFLGVFADWADQELPAIPVPISFPKQHEGVAMLQRLLESAFAMGFVTAAEDQCHLLFAAWNALGKNDLWNTNQHGVQMITTLPRSLSTLVLQLREDVAFVNRLALRATSSFHPTSTLLKAIDQMDTIIKGYSVLKLKSEVKLQVSIMIQKASKIVDLVLQEFMPSDAIVQQDILPEFFCVLESCAAYLSFAISTCTRPKFDFFSSIMLAMTERAMQHRDRGYSSDSGDNHSDGGSEESNDVLIDTMERVQDVCDCIGAAPAHPDWLDKDCHFWEGLSPEDASEAAMAAQACLTKLLSVGLMRSRLAHQLAVQNCLGEGQESVARLASNLWWLQKKSPKQSGVSVYSSGERDYLTDIGTVCGLDAETSSIVLADAVVGSRHAATESWQGHSAQRVLGRYQEPLSNGLAGEVETAELRASSEWEVLLSGALTSASIFVKFSSQSAVVDEDVCSKLICSGRWSGVCKSAIDSLVPTVALLRFCLCSEGRVAHPLSSVDASIASFDSKTTFSMDGIPDGVSISRSTIDAVILTVGTLALYPSLATCDMIAAHLLVDFSQFESLRGMEVSSLALQVLSDLHDLFEAKAPGSCEASSFVLERVADILKLCSTFQRDDGRRIPSSILGSLRHESGLPFARLTLFVTKENTEPSLALARAHSFTSSPGYSSLTNWSWEQPRMHFLQYLLSPFWKKSLGANERTLTFFADCLSSMIVMECNETSAGSSTLQSLLLPLAICLNQLSDGTLTEIIHTFICTNSDGGTETQSPECMQGSMCTIIAFVLTSKDNGCTAFTRSDLILSTIQDAYDEWKTFPFRQREQIMDLMLLLAFQRNKVFQIGENIFEGLKAQLQLRSEVGHSSLENAKLFTDCVLAMKSALSKKAVWMPMANPAPSKSILSSLPDKCTYASVSDFHDQHWYNCYSCMLTSDKGCCSLCAVVCHQGHDVEYARYSSFFCDCGGGESLGSPAKCRCCTTHSRDKFLKNQYIVSNREASVGGQSILDSLLLSSELFAEILKSSFVQEGQQAINELLGKGQKAAWTRLMFKCANQQFEKWKSHRTNRQGIFLAKNCINNSYGALSNLLCERTMSTTVGRLKTAPLISLGASNTGMIPTKMSADSATNRVKRTRLSDMGIFRSVLDADSRGRLVFAEPRGLVYCSGFPVARYLTNSSATSFSRSAMRTLCTVETGVNAVGVMFSQDNENMVVAWGIDESKIVLMNENLTSAISITALDCGTCRAELDNIIVNAHWLHGSGTGVILGFRSSLLVFNILKADDKSVCPVALTISTKACNSAVRDFAIVPFANANGNWKGDVSCWFVYLLMDSGAVYSTRVWQTSDGDYHADAIDLLNPLHFQVNKNVCSTHTSPQKGISLTYLDQSNLLLYQASNSAVVAIRLDQCSGLKSSFELLPYDLSQEPKTESDDNLTGRGPYTHWKELGSVSHGSTNSFRLSCCAQPSGEGEPLLLCLEFNQNETRVQEFTRTATGWFDPPQSCEGVALFSAPLLCNDATSSKLCLGNHFVERLFLCTLSMNGCLHIYAETVVSQARAALALGRDWVPVDGQMHMLDDAGHKDPFWSVLKFEKLKNLTESKNLTFHADSHGSSEMIRDKLLIANGESFLVSSWSDGFTLTISYRENNCLLSPLTKTPLEGFVISALRISVGAYSVENIPKCFRIMGRIVPLKPGQKRWYSIQLSEEEIALSVRSGFVTIDIDQCFDSSNKPVLDAMEVYGLTRKDIEPWFPLYLRECAASFAFTGSGSGRPIIPMNLEQNQFQLCLMALTNLHSLLGTRNPKKEEETFVRQLVQDTALETDSKMKLCVAGLVASLKPKDDIRQPFLDMAMLSGCSAFLKECQLQLNEWESGNLHDQVLRLWHSITPLLRNCLHTAANIAKHRPFNYLQVAEERPQAFESIAADACELAHKYLTKSLGNDTLVSDLVELSLLEIAIINGRRLGRFGSFGSLQNFISSESKVVAGQACSAIAAFCRESDIFHTLTKAVQYICDSCFAVISDTRYTSLDDAQPFDLCPSCYGLGMEFVIVENPTDVTNVIIKGQPIGDDHKLTCGAVKGMQAVVIRNDATESGQETQAFPGKVVETVQAKAPLSAKQQLFSDFMDILISGVSEHIGDWLEKPDYVPDSMVWLSVEFVRHSFQNGRKLNKAKKLAKALVAGLSCRLKKASTGRETYSQHVLFMEGLISLVLPNQSARAYLIGASPSVTMENHPPPGIRDSMSCNHGAPKVLRFIEGADNNRLFLGCPLDKKERCNFFAWADEPMPRNEGNNMSDSIFLKDGANLVWQLLTESHGDENPLNLLLASCIKTISCKELKENKNSADALGCSEIGVYSFDRDFADGVFCSHLRLKKDSYEQTMCFLNQQYREQKTGQSGLSISFSAVEKSLYLLALTAVPGGNSHSKWFPILCQIMMHRNVWGSVHPILAKASLKKLCGARWRPVCDFYNFTFKFQKLIECGTNVFRYFVLLNEKARQCSPSCKSSTVQRFASLKIADFAGTEFLMSEDASTVHLNDGLSKVLADLWASANKRVSSWRRFCSLRSLHQLISVSVLDFTDPHDLFKASPLLMLFSLSCALSAENQVKVLQLIHLGLVHSNDQISQKSKAVKQGKSNSADDDDIEAAPEHPDLFGFLGVQGTSAADTAGASIDDLYAYVLCLVYRGDTSEIRSLASKVAIRLCQSLPKQDMGNLVTRFMQSPLYQCATFGKNSSDFLSFLHLLVKLAGPSALDVPIFTTEVQSCFKQQILALRHDRLNKDFIHFETRSNAFVQKKKYDLCSCVSCCLQIPRVKEKVNERTSSMMNAGNGSGQGSNRMTSSEVSKLKWAPGQVSPFSRCRLHTSRESFASNEFSMFYSLKNRSAISEIHVEVENPRRHVKTINFYFTPRPVEDPNILKSEGFADNWQLCGTLNLSRGSSRATLTISTPIVAANLKIEYADFFDAGSSRSADGTLVVLCPQCTRAVTNAHGVCSNCGEVAFQCRKCRHINYDRLDAFLCVECGYCASASVQFELTAGVASNAVAITNDAEYNAMVKMSSLALQLSNDLRLALKEKLAALVQCKKKKGLANRAESASVLDIDTLRRAFEASDPSQLGMGSEESLDFSKLTVNQLGKRGSMVKIVAHPGSRGESPFYRLARRAQRSSEDRGEHVMIQGLRVEDETASELLGGLLDGPGGLARLGGIDAGDPLSQLLASVQSRRERREANEHGQSLTGDTGISCNKKSTHAAKTKVAVEECDRLFDLMREAEREAYMLECRCMAWRRLNSGRLRDLHIEERQPFVFEPSHCSSCASTIAVQLLVLWLHFFRLNPDVVVIDQEIIALLLHDVATGHLRTLQEIRKAVVKEIAIHSKQGRLLVVDALRARLILTHDVNSAEILDKILESIGGDTEAAAPFVALAREALEHNANI